jgi:hypothetical protein
MKKKNKELLKEFNEKFAKEGLVVVDVNGEKVEKKVRNYFSIKGRKISALELLGMLEDSDNKTDWEVFKL